MNSRKPAPFKLSGLTVEVRGNFERALRTFNKKVQSSGLLKDLRDKEYYEKPTSRRKLARQIAKKREQKRREEDSLKTVSWEQQQ